VRVERLPRPDDPGLLAVVHAVEGLPDRRLAEYDRLVPRRRTDWRPLAPDPVPDDVLVELTSCAAAEGALLVPVVGGEHRRLRTRQVDAPRDVDRTLVLLSTPTDERAAWLRCGEALQHVLLEVARQGWVAGPVTRPVGALLARSRLRGAPTAERHPQLLLRIGHAPTRSGSLPPAGRPAQEAHPPRRRPVSDGRGGTTWG
jgi:hypothetical protein